MKRLLVIISVALLIMGHTLSLKKNDILIGAPNDLIEIHSGDLEEVEA